MELKGNEAATTKRRDFLKRMGLGLAAAPSLPGALAQGAGPSGANYEGPRVVIIRYGGGVRPREVVDPNATYSPFFTHELTRRGTLFSNIQINSGYEEGVGHGKGTLYLMTGKYAEYQDVDQAFLGERYEAEVPTIFEYFRKAFNIPRSEALIINGEDRVQEEFYSFSNHHLFGVEFRSDVLSLYQYKRYLLESRLESFEGPVDDRARLEKLHAEMKAADYRITNRAERDPRLVEFWDEWRRFYGTTGLVNPRGDRVLTELATRAIQRLRAKLIMVNYNDPDYAHWGYMAHYTRAISIIDQGIQRIVDTVENDEEYRDNTLFVIVPDCGRDTNPFHRVPCQHHFGAGSANIFGLIAGPGVRGGQRIDKPFEQIDFVPTIAALTGLDAPFAEGTPLEDAIA